MKIMRLLLLFSFSSFNLFAGEKVRFHKAETEAEKFTEDGIKGNFDPRCLYIYNEYLDKQGGKISERKPTKDVFEKCNKYMTKDLMMRVSKAERESCNNDKYGYDHGCFIEIDLILCAQDTFPGGLSFKAVKEAENEVELAYVNNYEYMQGFQEEFDKCVKANKKIKNGNLVHKICEKEMIPFENKIDNFDLYGNIGRKIYLKKEDGIWKFNGSDCIEDMSPSLKKS